MSSISERRLADGPKIQLLDEEQAARSVVVSNIAPQSTEGSVTIHFQKNYNIVETVLKHSHKLEGSTLKIHRFIPDDPPEVFQQVKARVDFDRLQLSPQELQKALKVLEERTVVECRGVSQKEYVLSGTFNQIESAQKLFQDMFHRRASVQRQSEGGNETFHYGDTTQTQQNSSETWDTEAVDNVDSKDLNSFEVQPQFMKLLKRVYKTNLQDIEEKYGVEIVWSENATHVKLHPCKTPNDPDSYQKGCDAFIDLYQM
ncbi:hypothetical protein ACROYT_G011246 [Oculina patagonica]